MSSSLTLKAPEEWPPEILDEYEPVRVLGKGGFASVILAKRRNQRHDASRDNRVALKVVGSRHPSKISLGYAHREMDILRELSHPRIMRLIKVWEPPPEQSRCAAVMALSYAPGPTLLYILEKIGAPSLLFSRVVSAQLIDALAYCHSRGVIHRDIKPTNVIVTGATLQQTYLCEDPPADDLPDWPDLRKKWHVTLIDFGCARALGPDDVKGNLRLQASLDSSGSLESTDFRVKEDDLSRSLNDSMTASSSSSRQRGKRSLRISRHMIRTMSALGNRSYAAPEVKDKVRETSEPLEEASEGTTRQKATLSKFVADYGMTADAFSAGLTVRYILTGVAPEFKVEEVVANYNAPSARAARWMRKRLSKNLQKDIDRPNRGKRYRSSREVPAESVRMIKGMTHWKPEERTTIRAARLYPWIDDILEPSTALMFGKINFLKCATKHAKPTVIVEADGLAGLKI